MTYNVFSGTLNPTQSINHTASSLGCQPSTDSAATSADHIWWSGVCCRWSVDVELTAKTSTWPLF